MKTKTCVILSVIWTIIWIGFGIVGVHQIYHWSELYGHLKFKSIAFLIFVPLAWSVGIGKIWLFWQEAKDP